MKQTQFSIKSLAIAIIALLIVGCTNDDIPQNSTTQQPDTKDMTEFIVVDNNTNATPTTRTTGEYTGSGIKFYWTSNDQLWINNTAVASPLKASNRSDIPTVNGKEITAKFYFDGVYSAQTYPVRYTGNNNPSGKKVTIKAEQAQQIPNDGSHIGTSGDCGTATAHRQSNGSYQFTLSHKASYLTIYPYYSYGLASSVKVTQIKVTADQPVAGTYDFNDNGLDITDPTTTSRSITLKLKGGGTNGFEIPTAQNYTKNAAIMVIAPGAYTNFTVEYTLHDQITNVTGTVSKNYGSVTCNEGENKKIEYNLALTNYRSDLYYMWDANQHYWHGYEEVQPELNGDSNPNYPHNNSDPRWHKEGGGPATRLDAATALFKTIPNVNEMLWYLLKGSPRWDSQHIWVFRKHLYASGAWFKKKSKIADEQHKTIGEMKEKAPDGIDHRTVDLASQNIQITPSTTIPNASELSDYFFLPSLGDYRTHPSLLYGDVLTDMGAAGNYWSSSAHQSTGNAFGLYIDHNAFMVGHFYRSYGFTVHNFE